MLLGMVVFLYVLESLFVSSVFGAATCWRSMFVLRVRLSVLFMVSGVAWWCHCSDTHTHKHIVTYVYVQKASLVEHNLLGVDGEGLVTSSPSFRLLTAYKCCLFGTPALVYIR